MNCPFKRYALVVTNQPDAVAAYMPDNYEVMAIFPADRFGKSGVVIGGRDSHGWTLDDYVIPRLASGLHFATEIDISHPIMKRVPA